MSSLTRRLPSPRRQRQLSYLMELMLVGMLFIGFDRGEWGVVVNTGVALAVTQLPALLERDLDLPMDPRLTLWITSAAFLHALGTVVPGVEWNFYSVHGFDHLTHALSASVVAAAGYATVRAVDEHSGRVHFPPKFVALVILLFVLAFGVLWELLEFAIGIASERFGTKAALAQHGVYDTLWDLVFDSVGAVIVAIWGGVYLSDVTTALTERFGSD